MAGIASPIKIANCNLDPLSQRRLGLTRTKNLRSALRRQGGMEMQTTICRLHRKHRRPPARTSALFAAPPPVAPRSATIESQRRRAHRPERQFVVLLRNQAPRPKRQFVVLLRNLQGHRQGVAGGLARHGAANEKSAFAESTSQATGKRRRVVEIAAARGAAPAVMRRAPIRLLPRAT